MLRLLFWCKLALKLCKQIVVISRSMFHLYWPSISWETYFILFCFLWGTKQEVNEIHFGVFQDIQLNLYNKSEIETWNLLFAVLESQVNWKFNSWNNFCFKKVIDFLLICNQKLKKKSAKIFFSFTLRFIYLLKCYQVSKFNL